MVHARGYCDNHYRVWKRNGTPTPAVKKTWCYTADCDPKVEYTAKLLKSIVKLPSGCWRCRAGHDVGYGYTRLLVDRGSNGVSRFYAHRLSYEHFVGEVPDGMFILHRCDNRSCCNPKHLFLGTKADNTMDMVSKSRYGRRASLLSEVAVLDIYQRHDAGEDRSSIAGSYKLRPRYITLIMHGKVWKHLFKQYRCSESV